MLISNFIKNISLNILLLILALIISYYTAPFFGGWYDKISPQYDFSFFNLGKESVLFIVGFPISYVFLITILFSTFGFGRRKVWTGILLTPAVLLWLNADLRHIYIPIILIVIAWVLGLGLRK